MIHGFINLVMLCLRNVLHAIPISVRRLIVKKSTNLPLWFNRFVLNVSTSPIGDEIKWIHNIKQSTWEGVWIVPNLESVKQAEYAAVNSDLVLLYTHGNYILLHHSASFKTNYL